MAYPVMDNKVRAVLYYQGAEIELRVTEISIQTCNEGQWMSSVMDTAGFYMAGPVEAEYQITGVATDSDYTPPPTIDVQFGWTRAPKRESIETVISNALNRIAREALNGVREKIEAIGTLADLQREKLELKEELETLRIEKDRKEEEQERKIREVEHKVGLEKARTEFEVEAAKREAVLDVREENLTEAQERFESQMRSYSNGCRAPRSSLP
jgi:hypothetical protein